MTPDRITPGDELAEAVRKELLHYASSWIRLHLLDDHMVTLDHKDEIGLMETLLALHDALDRYNRLTR